MDEKVKIVSKSFDKTIEMSREGINQYETLPAYIVNTMQFEKYKDNQMSSTSDSGNPYIKDFLNPQRGLKFLDIGCCLNLMNRGYQNWLSIYYGLDISPKIIEVLEQYISINNISIGKLVCADMANIPFQDQHFEIAECIGSLEYYAKEYVTKAIGEFSRVLKVQGRIVLDIPNIFSDECKLSMKIEDYLGRKDDFNMTEIEFEQLLRTHFDIKDKIINDTIQYYCVKK